MNIKKIIRVLVVGLFVIIPKTSAMEQVNPIEQINNVIQMVPLTIAGGYFGYKALRTIGHFARKLVYPQTVNQEILEEIEENSDRFSPFDDRYFISIFPRELSNSESVNIGGWTDNPDHALTFVGVQRKVRLVIDGLLSFYFLNKLYNNL